MHRTCDCHLVIPWALTARFLVSAFLVASAACYQAVAATVYETTFDGFSPGQTQPAPGAPGHDGWYQGQAVGSAVGEFQTVVANGGLALHQFAPALVSPGTQTIDRRGLTPPNLAALPVVTLSFDFRAHSSSLAAANTFIAALTVEGGPHPGFEVLAVGVSAGNGTRKSDTGVNLGLSCFNGVNANEGVPLTVGQGLAWDAWHHIEVALNQARDEYLYLVVDGAMQSLTGKRLPRSEDGGIWKRGQLMESLTAMIVPDDATGARTDDDVFWDNIRLSAATGGAAWPMRQRDAANIGRADFSVPASRLNANFFGTIRWQKPSPDSPTDGGISSSSMVFFDGAGPGGADLVVAGYHWPKGVQGMDRHTGARLWYGNPDGGESIGRNTPAFSTNGKAIYVINDATDHPLMAFAATDGPSVYRHNGADGNPGLLAGYSPKVAPDGRIFVTPWLNRPRAGTDNGTSLNLAWSAASDVCACNGSPALWEGPSGLAVVSAGRCATVKGWNGSSGDQLWSVDLPTETDAEPTINPANGKIYLPIGTDSIWVVGLNADGNALWSGTARQVFTWQDGVNNRQRAQSAGCLAVDGLTYYFQTVSAQGDGRLYAIRTTDGSVKWSVNTASRGWEEVCSSPVVTSNGVVVVGNNNGGAYYAILDAQTNGLVIATLPVASGGTAKSSATLSPDGMLYLAARLDWTRSNGDQDAPTYEPANVFTAFDLNEGPDQPPLSGMLYVDLRATDDSAGSATWTNRAAPGHFTRHGAASLVPDVAGTGIPGVYLDGEATYYEGPASVADLEGRSDRSVEVWVLNPQILEEETLVAWGQRGGPAGANFSINYGYHESWGAAGHWDWDLGWQTAGAVPASNVWHHFVYTYNGGQLCKFYVDGRLVIRGELPGPLQTLPGKTVLIGAQHENETDFSFFFSGYINSVRVHGGVLSSNEVSARYALGPARSSLPGSNLVLTVVSAYGAAVPPAGAHEYTNGQTVACSMPVTTMVVGDTEYGCTGWTGSGSVSSGSGSNVTVTLTSDSTLTWVWMPARYALTLAINGNGHVDLASQWVSAGAARTVRAVAAAGWQFDHWSGDTNGCVMDRGEIQAVMSQPRQLTAHFVVRPNPWQQVALPESSSRGRHTALGSDGTNVYFTRAEQAAAPFYRIAKGVTSSGAWQTLTPLPIVGTSDGSSGVGDLAYCDGALWTLARYGSPGTTPCAYRYDIAANDWAKPASLVIEAAPNSACSPLATNRILGCDLGTGRLYVITDWRANAKTQLGTLAGGSSSPWDACFNGQVAWFLKHHEGPATNGVLTRVDYSSGSAVFQTLTNGVPFNPGMGCAVEFLPGRCFPDNHDRLCLITGGASNNGTDLYWRYGESWTVTCTANNMALYDLATGVWSVGTLPFGLDGGSEMCLAGDTLYLLAANGVTDPLRFLALGSTNTTLMRNLTVHSVVDAVMPPPGSNQFLVDQVVPCSAPEIVQQAGVEYRCTGWHGTGNAGDGSGTNATVFLTDDSALTWLWATNRYLLDVEVLGSGHANIASAWFAPGTIQMLTAYPSPDWQFAGWEGDTNGCSTYGNTVTVTANRPRHMTARFTRATPITGATRFVSPSGSHTPPFNSWLTAATNLQAAVNAAGAGETILVTNGLYLQTSEIALTNGISLRSVNGPGLTVIDGGGVTRCLRLSHSNALVDGFTITGGWTTNSGGGVLLNGATLQHSIVMSNNSSLGSGGGIFATQGCLVEYCQVIGNSATNAGGGGFAESTAAGAASVLRNCVIAGNRAKTGGGVWGSTTLQLRNLLVLGNVTSQSGAGIWAHQLQMANCSVVENTASSAGGVYVDWSYGSSIANCIIDQNHIQTGTSTNYYLAGTPLDHTYTVPSAGGFSTRPDFADADHGDFRLRPGSAGIDQGANQAWMTNAVDWDGRTRILNGTVDLGPAEFDPNAFFCDLAQTGISAFVGEPVKLEAVVFGAHTNGLTYAWDLDGNGTYETTGADLRAVAPTFTDAGTHTVGLLVSNDLGQVATTLRVNAVEVGTRNIYVSPDGAAWPPYTNWLLAARSINAALEVARDGSTIWVTNGLYRLTRELRVVHGITLRSLNGADSTLVDGNGTNRCLWIAHSNARVQGFTLTNGCAVGGNGGGAFVENGTLSNCLVISNRATISDDVGGYGGGIHLTAGLVEDCVVLRNGPSGSTVEVERGLVDRCVVRQNYGYYAGGVALRGSGTLRNSVIAENSADERYHLEAVAAGVLLDFSSGSVMESCTVVSNRQRYVGMYGGDDIPGVFNDGGLIRNSIVASNDCGAGQLQMWGGTNLFVCSSDTITGPGNFQADPRFVNLAGGDYRLRGDSPCINAGTNLAWMAGAADLDGSTRIREYQTDLGAYEFDPGAVTLVWAGPADDCLHGTETLAWETVTGRTQAMTLTLRATRLGNPVNLGTGLNATGSLAWDTTRWDDGQYELRAILRDGSGQITAELVRPVLINNSVLWHGGLLTASEVWSNGTVHLVEASVTIAAGRTLTILPGSIVKCAPGVKFILQSGAYLVAEGTLEAPIIFSSLADDAAGGDSNGDGNASQPRPGDWLGFESQGTAALTLNDYAETRYLLLAHSGNLTQSETWAAASVHVINGGITVPAGVTLTINPGAVIKFNSLAGMSVAAGGTLLAEGTLARPVTFTSIRDDAFGGDSNGDGGNTTASPGDWGGIQASGTVRLTHAILRYGSGGEADTLPALLKANAPADVTVLNSRLEHGLHDAVNIFGGSTRLTNCVLANCGRGLLARATSTAIVVNCTFHQLNWGLANHGGVLRVFNSILANCAEVGVETPPTEFAYNNVWSATSGAYDAGINGNISVAPNFRDPDAGNFQLGFRSPMIDAADTTRAPATDAMNLARYDDPRSANTGVTNALGAVADMGAFEFVEGAASDFDLVAQNVAGPSAATAGQTVTVSWQVRNAGSAAVTGQWHDQVLLVPETSDGWNQAIVVTEVLSSANLGPGATAQFSAAVRVPGGTEGNWHWQVKANARGEIFEGANGNNNASAWSAALALSVPELPANGSLQGMLPGPGQAVSYKTTHSSGLDTLITLDTLVAEGRVRLYAGFGRMPTEQAFDARSSQWNSPDATVALPGSAGTVTYLMLMPEQLPYSPAAYRLTASAAAFGIVSVSPTIVGNAGSATVAIQGYGFTTNTQVGLSAASGATHLVASQWALADSMRGYATFNLNSPPLGFYHVGLQDGTNTAVRSNGVYVVVTPPLISGGGSGGATGGGKFQARLSLPSAVRPQRVFRAFVNYENVGTGDMPAPLLIIEGDSNTALFPVGGTNEGSHRLHFLATAQGRPKPSVLSPGTKYTFAFQGITSGSFSATVKLYLVGTDRDDPMDYATLKADIIPEHPHPLFDAAYELIATHSAATQGGYVEGLGELADRAAAYQQTNQTERALLTYELREAVEAVQDATVSGTAFLGDTNHPLGRVQVFLSSRQQSATNLYGTTAWYDGTFGIRNVPPGRYSAWILDHDPLVLSEVIVPDAPARATNLMLIAESGRGMILGELKQAFSPNPIPKGVVSARNSHGVYCKSATSDANGRYRLEGLANGTYEVSVDVPGAQPVPPAFVEVTSGQANFLSFLVYSEGGRIQGMVRDSHGNLVAGASVAARRPQQAGLSDAWPGREVVTDVAGQFELKGLPVGLYELAAAKCGLGVSAIQRTSVGSDQDAIVQDLTLGNQSAVSGIVCDAGTSLPIEGAKVSVNVFPSVNAVVTTGADGRYTIPNLIPGSWSLCAYEDGHILINTNIEVAAPGTTTCNLALAPWCEVVATVSEDGKPLMGAAVTLTSHSLTLSRTLLTDVRGGLRFHSLPPGSYSIALGSWAGMSLDRQEFTLTPAAPRRSFAFNLQPARIQGLVQFAGAPLPGTMATVLRSGKPLSRVKVDDAGAFTLFVRETGSYEVAVGSPQVLFPIASNVTITALGQSHSLAFAEPTNTVAVSLTDALSGLAVSNAAVTLLWGGDQNEERFPQYQETDATGHCRFDRVTPGAYLLHVQSSGRALLNQPVMVQAGTQSVALSLTEGRCLHGRLTADGDAYGYATVQVCDADGRCVLATAPDDNGLFGFPSLPAARYDLVVLPVDDYAAAVRTNLDLVNSFDLVADVNLAAPSPAVVSGWVVNSQGNRVTRAMVTLSHGRDGIVATGFTDDLGEFQLRNWPPGRYQLSVEADDYETARQVIDLSSGEALAHLALTLNGPVSANTILAPPNGSGTDSPSPGRIRPRDPKGDEEYVSQDLGVDFWCDFILAPFQVPVRYADEAFGDRDNQLMNYLLSGGMMDPEMVYSRNGVEEQQAELSNAFEKARSEGRADCVGAAYEAAEEAHAKLVGAQGDWLNTYTSSIQTCGPAFGLALSRATLIAVKAVMYKKLVTETLEGGVLSSMPGTLQKLVAMGMNILGAEWARHEQAPFSKPSKDVLRGYDKRAISLSILLGRNFWANEANFAKATLENWEVSGAGDSTAASGMKDVIKQSQFADRILEKGGKAATGIFGLLDLAKEYNKMQSEWSQANSEIKNRVELYFDDMFAYENALAEYVAARERFRALQADCKTSEGTEAENPDYLAGDEIQSAQITIPHDVDPNDKITTGLGPNGIVQSLERIYYTIHFENVRTATAPAQLVIVTDKLHPSLDERTFELGEIGFNNTVVWPPAGLTRFDSTTRVTTDPNPVRIHAELDPTMRTANWTLQSVDAVTGDYPEDPWAGFLPPNTTNQIGEGYVTFSILPKTNAGGVFITNRSVIVFGVNAPLATPVVTNLVDQTPPVSAVNPLPAYSATASFLVSWSGTDVGAGIASYDIFVSSNGGAWRLWLANTPTTSAVFPGRVKTTYAFYSIATDRVGNIEAAPVGADATTTTADNQAPVLAPISDGVVRVNESLIFTNVASDPDGDALRFSLGAAPTGVTLTPDTGVLRWTPTCAQGSTTNLIQVRVTDNGTPPMSASQSFQVIVPECIEAGLGGTVMQVGTTSSVPVRLLSTVALTNLTFDVLYPAERLTNFVLTPSSPHVLTQQLRLLSPGRLEMSFTLPGSSVLHGPTNAADLAFVAPTNQTSAFVPLLIVDVDGMRPDGGLAANARGQPGRAVVIGREPLLEGVQGADGRPRVLVYGNPGVGYQLERRTNVSSGTWESLNPVLMTNLWRNAYTGEVTHPKMFFRAH